MMNIPQQNHILVGLGGTGGKVLKAFKKRLFQEFTPEERKKLPVGFLYVDTTDEMMHPGDKSWQVLGENAQFNANEFLFIKGIQLEQVFASPSSYPGLKGIVGDPEVMQKCIGTLGVAAGQMRRAGRILFGANISRYRAAMENVYKRVNDISKASGTCIYIFGGLAGGTGSGSIVDVVAQTRKIDAFKEEYHTDTGGVAAGTDIVAFCMIPEVPSPAGCDAGRYHANGYAALSELNGLLTRAWKPYDVTGMSPTGRLEFPGISKVVDGVMVYTNGNEKGVTVEPHHELPKLVSDFVFMKIFLEYNEHTTGDFIRSTTFENITVPNEMFEKAKGGAIVPYRTRTVGSFGIKRVVIPEEEIKEFFTWSLGRQALLQLRYNNWNDDQGYRNAPANVDWADYVKGQDRKLGNPLENWHFSDKHLMLDIPILPSDEGKWSPFQSYWGKVVPKWLEDAQGTPQPIAKLNELCAKGVQAGFRNAGVADFFAGKKDVREKLADEIVQRMEADLFDKWANGTFALYNLLELSDAIIAETQARIKLFEDRAVKLRALLDKLEGERQAKAKEYNDAGLIIRGLKGRQMLAGYAEVMQKICQRRTEVEACGFALDLLKVLTGRENLLRSRLEQFVGTVSDAIEDSDRQVGALCKDEVDTDNLEGTVIRYYDQPKVKAFVQSLIHDKKNQENISTAVRQEILRLIGTEKTFARANAAVDEDALVGIFEKTVREKVIAIHDNTLVEDGEKLINRNILEQLSEKYTSAEGLQDFAAKIISESGVLARFNASEVNRYVSNNNSVAAEIGKTFFCRRVLVNMPKVEGKEKVQKFAEKLKTALENATDASDVVKVDMSGDRMNEITVMSVVYSFPFRVLHHLTFYKEKLDALTTVTPFMPETEVRKNKVLLWGEGFGGEGLPDLFVAPEKQKSQLRKEYMSWILLAYVMGIIRYGDISDGTGRKMYGTVETDEDTGFETLLPIAARFSEIGTSERFTEDFCEAMKAAVEDRMRGPFLHVEQRVAELRPKVQALLNETLLPETGNNQGSPAFLEFLEAAKKAIQILKN
ncbi:MAG: hypothetical protein J5871_00740 [Bacteroidales bacterium]|nr:hypothetical protein [Bacteroidales bacterium]